MSDRHGALAFEFARARLLARGGLLAVALVALGPNVFAQRGPVVRPEPRFDVRVEPSVMVPMRDGTRLSTDLYFPVGVDSDLPVILIRTPYNKLGRGVQTDARFFAGHGFAVAVQDLRGKYESEGRFVKMSGRDPLDGYDTIDWLVDRPWAAGRVGTYGCSYLGETQIALAAMRHPSHAAAIPKAAGGNYAGRFTYFGQFEGGVVELAGMFGWETGNGSKVYYRPPAWLSRQAFLGVKDYFEPAPSTPPIDYAAVLWTLPTIDMMKRVDRPPNDYEAFLAHDPGAPYWDSLGYTNDDDRFDVPALHVDSWYNGSIAEQLDLFNLLQTNAVSDRARDNQFAIISPTTHCGSERATERTMAGDRPLGDARLDYYRIYLRWFDHWLKEIDNGVTSMPKLQLYVMGRNEWRTASEWPLRGTVFTKYFLRSDGRANSRFGTGALSADPPGAEAPDRFVYDPRVPVPTLGGSLCCTGNPRQVSGSFDQSELEMRHDVLVYTSPPLEDGVEVTGPMEVVLYVSSSARDTDFTAKLVDVYPDGRAFNIRAGIQRVRYREGYRRKVWMESGGVYEVRINLHATSNYFGPGHRIRLEISSSDFPRFERNLNTGGNNYDEAEWVVARNQVHHSREHPSHLILPVTPPGGVP